MPTYAILGATGSTGSSVLKCLLINSRPDLNLRLYVRSRDKLLALHPSLVPGSNVNIEIFEGSIGDQVLLTECLSGVDIIFSCIAQNGNMPGLSIATDTAQSLVSALKQLKQQDGEKHRYMPPTVLMLSSASVSPVFGKDVPKLVHAVLETALSNSYADLRRAEAFYRGTADDNVVNVIFAQPPALMPAEIPTGYKLSTTRSTAMLSYADLGAGLVEIAERKDEFLWKGVTIVATGDVPKAWGQKVFMLSNGVVAHFAPGFWSKGSKWGWW